MNLISREDYEDFLAHHQVRGAHWGEHNGPPYPLVRTPSGQISKKQERAAARIARKEARKEEKAQAKATKKAEKNVSKALQKGKKLDTDKMSDEEKETMKKEVAKSSDAKQIMKYKDLFSTEELRTMADRIRAEQSMNDLKTSDIDKGMAYIRKYRGYVEEGLNVYRTVKNVAGVVKEVNDAPKKAKERADKEALDAKKKKILDSKDWKLMDENSDMFSTSEIGDFIKRRSQEDTIKKTIKSQDDAVKKAAADREESARQEAGNRQAKALGDWADSLSKELDTHFNQIKDVDNLSSMIDELSSRFDKEFKNLSGADFDGDRPIYRR